ncbi:MAG: hypothetical protein PHO23_01615 [Candidatus Pacebacteria bacterium]|nr:hypothetical protein [Candidatus Paceibacterota bacterium]
MTNKIEQPDDIGKQNKGKKVYTREDLEQILLQDGFQGETTEKNLYLIDKLKQENQKIDFLINPQDGFLDTIVLNEAEEINSFSNEQKQKPEQQEQKPEQKQEQKPEQKPEQKQEQKPEQKPEQKQKDSKKKKTNNQKPSTDKPKQESRKQFLKGYEKIHGGLILEEGVDKKGNKVYKIRGVDKITLNREYLDFLTNLVGLKDKNLSLKERQLKLKDLLLNKKGKKNQYEVNDNEVVFTPEDKNQKIIETGIQINEGAAEVLRKIGKKRSDVINKKYAIDFKDIDEYLKKPQEQRTLREKLLFDQYYPNKQAQIEQIANLPKKKRETRLEERARKLQEIIDCLDQVAYTLSDKKDRQDTQEKINQYKKELADLQQEIKIKEAELYKNINKHQLDQTEDIQFTPGKGSLTCPNLGYIFSQYQEPGIKEKVFSFNAKLKQKEKETVFSKQDWEVLVSCCKGSTQKEQEDLCIQRLTKRAKLTQDHSNLKYKIVKYPEGKVALRIISPKNGVNIYTSLKITPEVAEYFKNKDKLLEKLTKPEELAE